MGCKYLTSPTLFELQLRDPALRQEVSVQILFFVHNLSCRLPRVLEAAAALAAAPAALSSSVVSLNRTAGSAQLAKTAAGAASALTAAASSKPLTIIESLVAKLRLDIVSIRKRVYGIIRRTPPNGEALLLFVKRLLHRERNWVYWKLQQPPCPSFERPPANYASLLEQRPQRSLSTSNASTAVGSKRRRAEEDEESAAASNRTAKARRGG